MFTAQYRMLYIWPVEYTARSLIQQTYIFFPIDKKHCCIFLNKILLKMNGHLVMEASLLKIDCSCKIFVEIIFCMQN